jgi:hypothetical protein
MASSPNTRPVGTPLWMAPEQVTGEEVRPVTDVWAMGLVAFRLLTGHLYWRSDDALPVLNELLYGPLPAASLRAAEHGAAHLLPPGFDSWFGRCVTRDPAARFPDAGVAREELRHLFAAALRGGAQTSPSVSDPPPTPVVPSSRPAAPQPPGAAYDARWYVPRDREEREARNYLAFAGKPAVLWGPTRFGKTWLMHRCLDELHRTADMESVTVSPGLLARGSMDALLEGLGARIVEARDTTPESLAEAWRRPGSAAARLTRLMERHVLPGVRTSLVLAIDGADAALGGALQDDLFALLRAWAEAYDEPWPRLRLLLTVSTTPSLLVRDPNRSPFNLTAPIVLGDLRAVEVEHLARRHGLPWTSEEIARVMDLVGGHPYLARLIMHRAALHGTPLAELLDPDLGSRWVLFDDLRQIRSWLARCDLLDVAVRVAEDPAARLSPDEVHRGVRAGVLVEETPSLRRLRNRLYALAATQSRGGEPPRSGLP